MLRGVRLAGFKLTEKKEVEMFRIPDKVVIPLLQHIGKPCTPLVKVGTNVKAGQKIADSKEFISAPVHSSVSGKVIAIKDMLSPAGIEVPCIVIKSDEKDEHVKYKKNDVSALSKDEIIALIKEAGIVGMGGAMFPTYAKYKTDERIDMIIANGAECEPYLTADHRLMLEHPKEIIEGLKILKKITNAKECVIGIEANKEDAIEAIKKHCESGITVKKLKTVYPHGAEKTLTKTVTKKEVPPNGLPIDVGVIVNNVATMKAIYDAVTFGKPLIERVVTVTGNVEKRGNYLVRIGTSFQDILDYCKVKQGTNAVIAGGPMMGVTQTTLDVPVTKGTNSIVAFTGFEYKDSNCIRCGRCVDACPMNLMPFMLSHLSRKSKFDAAKDYNVTDCVECGSCSYSCPAKIDIVGRIKTAKAELRKKK